MGFGMATNLAGKLPVKSKIHVFDIIPALMNDICAKYPERAMRCSDPKNVADKSDVIITMLPEGKHVKAVYMGSDGICSSDVGQKLLVDCSTIDTASFLEVKDHITKNFPCASFYDAPVSGGVIGSERGTIAFYLGCAENNTKDMQELGELFSLMGNKIILCGGPSLGLAAKLSNNYLSGIIAIACSEAMDMGMKSGLDPRVLAQVYAAGNAQNTICDTFNPVPGVDPDAPSSNGYRKGFKVQLMKKDISLALEMARRVGSTNVLGSVALQTYKEASEDERCKDLDSRIVFRYLGGNENWKADHKSKN
ncbi:NAD binding domain of 6-phosphogluconate dehydrogenase-domain-containing protein [Penicillium digitatum]|nr:NAD binding domain of 6-phosphogluconate dehydrogenase-domain-containing protein [Penicillium digitatum]